MTSTPTANPVELLTPGTWSVDHTHSSVAFSARHLMVSKVRGTFEQWDAAIEIADDPLRSSVTATIDVASVSTADETRDDHLRSADFFDAEHHPTMTFTSTEIRPSGADRYTVVGALTVRGVTRPVELDVELNGVAHDPWGGTRAGFSARTELSRKDFGLTWNVALETGGVVVSDKITIDIEVEAVKSQ